MPRSRHLLCGFVLALVGVAVALLAALIGPKAMHGYLLAGPLLLLAVGVALEGNRGLLRALSLLVGGVVGFGGLAVLWVALSWSGRSSSTPGVPGALAAFVGAPLLFAGGGIVALVFYGTEPTRADRREGVASRGRVVVRRALYGGVALLTVAAYGTAYARDRAEKQEWFKRYRLAAAASAKVHAKRTWKVRAHVRPPHGEDEGPLRAAAFTPSGRVVVTVGGSTTGSGMTVKAFSSESGEELGAHYAADLPEATRVEVVDDTRVLVTPDGRPPIGFALPALERLPEAPAVDTPVPPPSRRYDTVRSAPGVEVIEARTGVLVDTVPLRVSFERQVTWAPGADVLAVHDGKDLALWRPTDGVRWLEVPPAKHLAFSPDGALLLLYTQDNAAVVDVAAGEVRAQLRSRRSPGSEPPR